MDLNNYFTFGGVKSSDYGIYISGDGVHNAPERDVTMVTVPGRNGQLTIDNGRFENIEVTYPCFVEGGNGADITANIQGFRNAIGCLTGYQRLTDTYHTDEYREGIFKAGLDVSPVVYHTGGEFEIVFDCKPQRWLTSGETAITLVPGADDSGGHGLGVQISNPTEFNAAPLFKLRGYGTINIRYDNGAIWPMYSVSVASSITVIEPPLYVDCEILEAYERQTTGQGIVVVSHNADVALASDDPSGRVYIMPDSGGDNWVEVPNTYTSVEMIPRWWRI